MIFNAFTIIIPSYKDYRFVRPKIDNLMKLRYPADHIEILFVKGGCTKEQIIVLNTGVPLIKVIHTTQVGKTNQLNKGLLKAQGDIVMVTDIDSLLPPHTLECINLEMQKKGVFCVGVYSIPKPAHVIDRLYWAQANYWRYLESRFCTASHVTATCYAFKRLIDQNTCRAGLIDHDVIADDVYFPTLFNFNGLKTVILPNVRVIESRNPSTVDELVKHKSRKGNAFLRELLRFVYMLPRARGRYKIIFLVRLLQFMLISGWTYPFYQQDSNFKKVR